PLVRPSRWTSSMTTAATTAATSAVHTGELPVKIPTPTPARATWPMPSPMSDMRRCTRKNPTSGAATPTRRAASSASRMKSSARRSSTGLTCAAERVGAERPRVRVVEGVVVPVLVPVGEPLGRAVVGDVAGLDDDGRGDEVAERGELVGDDDEG